MIFLTCLAMLHIGDQVKDPKQSSMLRCPQAVLENLFGAATGRIPKGLATTTLTTDKVSIVKAALLERLKNGYTLARHRAASGEETVAFNRGPLVSTIPPYPATKSWPLSSNTGQDYQILDRTLGFMDISYSTAWQLGKTMAISDLGFVAALMRVRADAHKSGTVVSGQTMAKMRVGMKLKGEVLGNVTTTAQTLHALTTGATGNGSAPVPDLRERWSHAAPLPTTTDLKSFRSRVPLAPTSDGKLEEADIHPNIRAAFTQGVNTRIALVSSSAGTNGTIPYNELNPAASPDWAFVQSWLLDRMYLSGIPSHYLVTDPSYLPPESIRFFHIDKNWIEAYVDGALSVANHMSRDDDQIRNSIKVGMNRYFKSQVGSVSDGKTHFPQVPTYGFFLRSAVVTIFPDLVIEAAYPSADVQSGRTPLLVQKHMGKDVIFCLLDRLPESGQLTSIKFSQPPHQQRFSLGDFLDATTVEFEFRKVTPEVFGQPIAVAVSTPSGIPPAPPVANPPPPDFLQPFEDDTIHNPHHFWRPGTTSPPAPANADKTAIYDWGTRLMNLNLLATFLFDPTTGLFPTNKDTKDYWSVAKNNCQLTSAVLGLQLNDPIYYLEIIPPASAGTVTKPGTGTWYHLGAVEMGDDLKDPVIPVTKNIATGGNRKCSSSWVVFSGIRLFHYYEFT
jgi:hypothetical protein